MSIFKGTFEKYVADQINVRQELLNTKGNRPLDLQKYVSGKSPWVKMTSFVDYGDPKTNAKPTIDLAKKYVLLGGTLYPDWEDKTNTLFGLRSGILSKGSAYGTDLGAKGINKQSLQYGIRPMPGITNVSIKSKSAYGSLKEATVKFYAWDVKQLEDLLILFMRPGYPVLLEWGWSMYLDNESAKIKPFESPTINCFKPGLTQEAIYSALEKYREQFSGNYDGMLGLIRNYETVMLPNGGFECTTTLISIGDVIDSLKMNSENGEANQENGEKKDKKEYKDEFELLLSGYIYENALFINDNVKSKIAQINRKASGIPDIDVKIYKGRNNTGSISLGNGDDARYSYYMQFGYFIHLLNVEKNLYSKGGSILDIEIPLYNIKSNYGDGSCIASKNSVTIDNNSCIIKNRKATIVGPNGFFPQVEYQNILLDPSPKIMNEYLIEGSNLGQIGNIYVNIGLLVDLYKNESKNNNGQVFLGRYIKSILREMEYALGSVNSFDIFVNDNKLVIIDKHYVENPGESRYDSKFMLNILGTDSNVRNQKIISKIFPSQATMIAIAAQSRENVASLQSSTYNYMNKGLKSRLFFEITEKPEDLEEERKKEENILINNIQLLLDYINTSILVFDQKVDFQKNKSTFNTLLNNFLVKVEKSTNYRAIVPVSLEVSLDGIGGAVIGQIFRINKDILPKEYADKKVGFIVTGISHEITRPDWVTTYQTQFCLLDQDDRQKEITTVVDKFMSKVNDKIKTDREKLLNSVKLYNVAVGFFADWHKHRFLITPLDNTYNTSVKSKIGYKNGVSVKNLKALLEQYKPVDRNGASLTFESYIILIQEAINTALAVKYGSVQSTAKSIRFDAVRELVNRINKLGADRLDVVISDNDFVQITQSIYRSIMMDAEKEIYDLYFTNSAAALSDIQNKKDQTVFKLLTDKSVSDFGTFKPDYLSSDLTISVSSFSNRFNKTN